MALSPGTRLGPYEILAPLGAGGMGEVYRARDTRLGREVAIKVLPQAVAQDPECLARFERETRVVAALSHPNILAIHDVGREGDVCFAVLELLEGETLRQCLARGPLSWRRALEIAVPVAEGLAAAQARGIVHRDLKPDNIFLVADGRVKILDFGLARRLHESALDDQTSNPTEGPMTEPGVVMGTISYLSPEQARSAAVDGRSDVFSFGCVLYEMLTGRRAFAQATASETLAAILRDEPREPAELGIALPQKIESILRRCLRKSLDERFQSSSDLAFALRVLSRDESRPAGRPASGPSAAAAESGKGPVSIAVLPFLNMSSDRENEYFSDGMTEELINALAQVSGLRVASRTSSFAFKGKREDVRSIGERLCVTAVLEGSVRKAGDRLRITAQLVNAADGYHLWSEKYDREMKDVFAVQDEMARTIVERLKVRLALAAHAPLVRRHTSDPEAYNLYLKGRYFWNKRSEESCRAGIAYFEQAIARDPEYALAYAGLADCYIIRQGSGIAPREAMTRAKAAARKALELDEELAEAHASLARGTLYFDWDWEGAEKEFRRAIALNPAYGETYHAYSHYLLPAGRVEESLAASRRALELDPLDVGMVAHLGWHYVYAGDYDRSIAQHQTALEMDPSFFAAHIHLGIAYEQKAMYEEAIVEFQKAAEISSASSEPLGGLGHVYGMVGRAGEGKRVLDALMALSEGKYVSSFDKAIVCAGLGDREQALEWLERAAEERVPQVVELLIEPRLKPLRADPRFVELTRRVGLAK